VKVKKDLRQRCTDKEAVATYRRVLKLVNGYLGRNTDKNTLVGWDGGIMTWGEIRFHIRGALGLRHPMLRAGLAAGRKKAKS